MRAIAEAVSRAKVPARKGGMYPRTHAITAHERRAFLSDPRRMAMVARWSVLASGVAAMPRRCRSPSQTLVRRQGTLTSTTRGPPRVNRAAFKAVDL